MNISYTNTYPYIYPAKKHADSSSPQFKGVSMPRPTEVFTKKNIYTASWITLLASVGANLIDFDAAFLDCLPKVLFPLYLCMGEKIKELDTKIEFKKAKTLEEAKLYARNSLGIKKYEIDDLEYANWVNEGLTNVSNKFKGKVHFPTTVKWGNHGYASYFATLDILYVSKEKIDSCNKRLKKIIDKNSFDDLTKYNLGSGYSKYVTLLRRAYTDFDSLSRFEKYNLVRSCGKYKSILKQVDPSSINTTHSDNINKYGQVYYTDDFTSIYHEIGHCFDLKTRPLIKLWLDNFLYNTPLEALVIPKVNKTCTAEFIATTFSGYMQDEKYTEDVENLFKKLAWFKFPHKEK